MEKKQKARGWGKPAPALLRAAGRELAWGITGERKAWILAGAAIGALGGAVLGAHGFYTWQVGAKGPATVYFVAAVIGFVGTTAGNWWLDRRQAGGPKPEQEEAGQNDAR